MRFVHWGSVILGSPYYWRLGILRCGTLTRLVIRCNHFGLFGLKAPGLQRHMASGFYLANSKIRKYVFPPTSGV